MKRDTPEQIVVKLRPADVELGKDQTIEQACRAIEVSEQMCYRWRQKYGGMSPELIKELKVLQKENQRLQKAGTVFIEPGSPWENGYCESFNGKLRDECLNGELFLNLTEARYVVDRWRMDYNHHRPHSRLDWLTPAAYAEHSPSRRRPL